MPKKVQIKTKQNKASVTSYVNQLENAVQRKEARALLKLFKETTGARAKMWGESIIGFGSYTYYRANGDEGEMLATGFSMRKSGPVLYVLAGTNTQEKLLKKLGKHKIGKSCLYIKRLSDIDLEVLQEIIEHGLDLLKESHEVEI